MCVGGCYPGQNQQGVPQHHTVTEKQCLLASDESYGAGKSEVSDEVSTVTILRDFLHSFALPLH